VWANWQINLASKGFSSGPIQWFIIFSASFRSPKRSLLSGMSDSCDSVAATNSQSPPAHQRSGFIWMKRAAIACLVEASDVII
jgi:hypothetical protein